MPTTFSTRNRPWNVCATTASPVTATVSHKTSPSHMAARNGSTSRRPLVSTRATRAAMLGPGEPAATSRARAKTTRADRVTKLLRQDAARFCTCPAAGAMARPREPKLLTPVARAVEAAMKSLSLIVASLAMVLTTRLVPGLSPGAMQDELGNRASPRDLHSTARDRCRGRPGHQVRIFEVHRRFKTTSQTAKG